MSPPDARRIFVAVRLAVAAAFTIVTVACSRGGVGTGGQPDPLPVTVAVASTRDVPVEVRAVGAVEAYSTVEVRSQVGGVLEKVHFHEGDDVRPGDLLFSLDARPYEAALKSAQAALARDRILAETAGRDLERYGDLVKKEYVTQEEYDRIRSNAASLGATVAADEAAVESARVSLGYCSIRSAIEGRTGQLNVHAGNVVKENGDTPLVVINQVRPIYVAFSVPEQNLGPIRAGQAEGALAVIVRPSGDDDPLTGQLTFIDNAVDRTTGTLRLKATFPNADRALWPGEFLDVALRTATRRGAVLVPSRALQTGQNGTYLFAVQKDDTVALRTVSTGPIVGDDTVVEQGIAAGDRVVTDGQLRLVDGARVAIRP